MKLILLFIGILMMVLLIILLVVVFMSGYVLDRLGLEVLIFLGFIGISLGLFLMLMLN